MNTISETKDMTAPAALGTHPLANAKQRRRETLTRELEGQLEDFSKIAASSDMEFLAMAFQTWNGAFMGTDYGMASAIETMMRGHLMRVSLEDKDDGDDAEEIIQPDHVTAAEVKAQDVDALVQEAMQPATEQSESATQGYREAFTRSLESLFEDFLNDATDGERAILLETLEYRRDCAVRSVASPSELPLAFGFEYLLREDNHMVFRFPEACLPDVRAYDEWRKDATTAEMGIVAGLLQILQEDHWLAGFLRAFGWTVRGERGLKRLDPEWVRGEINEAIEDFTDKIDTAREMLAEYPELVKVGK